MGVAEATELSEEDDGELYRPWPRPVATLAGVRIAAVAASSHVLALSDVGALYAWGRAADGVLGIGPLPNLPRDADGHPFQPSPVKVEVDAMVEGDRFVQIAAADATRSAAPRRARARGAVAPARRAA